MINLTPTMTSKNLIINLLNYTGFCGFAVKERDRKKQKKAPQLTETISNPIGRLPTRTGSNWCKWTHTPERSFSIRQAGSAGLYSRNKSVRG